MVVKENLIEAIYSENLRDMAVEQIAKCHFCSNKQKDTGNELVNFLNTPGLRYRNVMIFLEQTEAEQLMTNLFSSAKLYSQRYLSPSVLRQIYRQYCKWRQLIKSRNGWWLSVQDERRIYAFDSYLVHYLLERCFWMRYGDNEVVCHLLSILFELDGHLGKIFDFRLLSTNRNSRRLKIPRLDIDENTKVPVFDEVYFFGSTWKSEILASEAVKPLDYFIEHAYKKRILFNNKRFAEQCIVQSINWSRFTRSSSLLLHPPCAKSFQFPDILPKLLRHGLFVRAGPKDKNVCKLMSGVIGTFASCGYVAYPPEVKDMANVLLRAVESVDIDMLMTCQRVKNRSSSVQMVIARVAEMNLLPNLKVRCSGPQELQHLCRRRIRMSLYDNWQLPNGIHFLPLPASLKDYVNLNLD